MRHLDLFAGIGGFSLAASWIGWETAAQVEWDKYCQKILAKNFSNVKRYGDIKEFDGTKYRGLIDILTGGFPCQPFSFAGRRKGRRDYRYLWPEMLRVIREIQPPWIIGENVPGIIGMELDNICTSLESEGYRVQPFIIPSAGIGAWDKRDRVWIIAHNNQFRCNHEQKGQIKIISNKIGIIKVEKQNRGGQQCGISESNIIIADINSSGRENRLHGGEQERETGKCRHYFKESDWWKRNWIEVASELCGSNARIPHRMDRIKSLGNSVNPYVVYQIFRAIEEFDNEIY